jgi:hypothetical protein
MLNNSYIVDLIINLKESGMKKSNLNLKKYLGNFLEILRETRSQFLQSTTSQKFEFMAVEYEVESWLLCKTYSKNTYQYTTRHLDIYWSNYVQTCILVYKYVQTYVSANHVLIILFVCIIFIVQFYIIFRREVQ